MSNQDRFMDDMHFCIEVLGLDDDAIQECMTRSKSSTCHQSDTSLMSLYSYQRKEVLPICLDYMTQTTLT